MIYYVYYFFFFIDHIPGMVLVINLLPADGQLFALIAVILPSI